MTSTRVFRGGSTATSLVMAILLTVLIWGERTTYAEPAFEFTGYTGTGIANPNHPNGPSRTGGYTFTATQDMVVTALGHWHRSLNDVANINEDRPIGLWNEAGDLMATVTMPPGTDMTIISRFRFLQLSHPVIVSPGQEYTIGVQYTSNAGTVAKQVQELATVPGLQIGNTRVGPFSPEFTRPNGTNVNDIPGYFGPNLDVSPLADSLPQLDRTPAYSFSGFTNVITQFRTVGFQFTVDEGMMVTDLGVWDQGIDGLEEDRPIGLWDESGALIATLTVPEDVAGELDGDFRYVTLDTPVMVVPGQTYTIGVFYSTSTGSVAGFADNVVTANGVNMTGAVVTGDVFSLTRPTIAHGATPGLFGPNLRFATQDLCPGFDDNIDTDNDGVPNGCDVCEGSDDKMDADADSIPDGCDICDGHDDNVDVDGEGTPDDCDICDEFDDSDDTDADGVPDGCDVCQGSNDSADADADGVPDGCDLCLGFNDVEDEDGDGTPDGCDTPTIHNITRMTDHFLIQVALNAANNGDVIEIDDGVHVEDNIRFPSSRDVTLRGAGADVTIIDGNGGTDQKPILDMEGTGQTNATVISDLTLRNGVNTRSNGGGALYIQNASPVFRNVSFRDNGGPHIGAGRAHANINSTNAVPRFEQCIFSGGHDAYDALGTNGGNCTLVQCLIVENSTFRVLDFQGAGTCTLINCTVSADGAATDVTVSWQIGTTVEAVNTIFIGGFENGGGPFKRFRCMWPTADANSTDNIRGTPTFVNEGTSDYRLAQGSLGIDAGDHDTFVNAGGAATDLGGEMRTVDECTTEDTGLGAFTYLDLGPYELQTSDADNDGMPDDCDICSGFDDNADADADGVPDGCDTCPDFNDAVDSDADGVADGCDICEAGDDAVDADGDGIPDACDVCPGSDDNADADNDGVSDCDDLCPDTVTGAAVDDDGCHLPISDVDDGAGDSIDTSDDAGANTGSDSDDDGTTGDGDGPAAQETAPCGCGQSGMMMMPVGAVGFFGIRRRFRRSGRRRAA